MFVISRTLFTGCLLATTLAAINAWAEDATGAAPIREKTVEGMTFVWIPSGDFLMGATADEPGHSSREVAQHPVHIAQGFWMGKYEVTVAQYTRFSEAMPSHEPRWRRAGSMYHMETGTVPYYRKLGDAVTGSEQPVVGVDWHDAMAFAQWMSQQSGMDCGLPSEAEWEYAARAGSSSRYSFGDDPAELCKYANGADSTSPNPNWRNSLCADDYTLQAAPVGSFLPNAFGLYDMHGNVREWVADCYHVNYMDAPDDGRIWQEENNGDCTQRMYRGGSWNDVAKLLRSASRYMSAVGNHLDDLGFRLRCR